ncbi:hypothetical protein SSX86_027303 [Deinandra increscens subsp. villosa]|uniref:Uncharacterized protein n=1 Tax=Deinandra increscens subsp. villosa TaxID=3103831 RepID=A0AAP0CMW4_9ASTR
METEIQVTNLVTALEKATLMAKQLQSTTTATASASASHSETIYASLHAAHRHLSLFLSHTAQSQSQPQPSTDVLDGDDEPMRIADEEQRVVAGATEDYSKMITIETVEERMRDFSIQNNKRLKRSLSSTSLAGGERRRWLEYEIESARAQLDQDPHVTRLRALDLIYQFHC